MTRAAPDALSIERIQPTSPMLIDWHQTMRAAYLDGNEAMWWESFAQLQYSVTRPHPRSRRSLFGAVRARQCVGALEVTWRVDRRTEPAQVELGVAPGAQGRGVGRELAAYARAFARDQGCNVLQAEVFVPGAQELQEWRPGRFLLQQGFVVGNVEDRCVLDLPWQGLPQEGPPHGGVQLLSWVGACPGRYEVEWTALQQQMKEDLPVGTLTRGDTGVDIAQMREQECRMLDQGWLLLQSMALIGERPVGFTELMVDRHDPRIAVQESTLVDRAARGRGIGRSLKVSNLQQLALLPPELQIGMQHVQTYTAQQNGPMQRLNEQFGFRRVGTMHDAELLITPAH
ncbi:MAG: GNAT family N-acetyltransferase [Allobranchiibius sp.]